MNSWQASQDTKGKGLGEESSRREIVGWSLISTWEGGGPFVRSSGLSHEYKDILKTPSDLTCFLRNGREWAVAEQAKQGAGLSSGQFGH